MSFSYRDRCRFVPSAACAVLAAAGLAGHAEAADTQFRPAIELRIESNTNKDLTPEPGDELDSMGYIADVSLRVDQRTQRSTLTFLPQLRLQEYPDANEVERFEALADLDWKYKWQRAELDLGASYTHMDVTNSEQPDAVFGEVNPDDPTSPQTGQSRPGETRDRFNIAPKFTYDLTERWGLGASLLYEDTSYESDDEFEDNVDYRYWGADVFATWDLSERSDIQVGPYVTYYEAGDDSAEIDAIGGRATYNLRWTEQHQLGLSVWFEDSDAEYFLPEHTEESDTAFGGEVAFYRRTQVSRLRLIAGSSSTPSSRGQKTQSHQFHAQYDRSLTQRLTLTAAARYVQDNAIGDRDQSEDRDYVRAELSARYWLSRDWFVGGGYRYSWQEYEVNSGDADNHTFFVTGGFRGLGWRP